MLQVPSHLPDHAASSAATVTDTENLYQGFLPFRCLRKHLHSMSSQHHSHLWRSCTPTQSWQGHDSPSLIPPTPRNLRICFLEVIAASSLKGTLRGPSSKYLSPMNGKRQICINKCKWIFLPRAPCDSEQPSHCCLGGPGVQG